MSGHAASPRFGTPGVTPELREATREMTARLITLGVLVGLLLALASIQSFALTTAGGGVAWISAFFGMLLLVAAVICFISPEGTFAALADILG